MTTFGELQCVPTGQTRAGEPVYRLTSDFVALDDVRGRIVVPAGYETDFVSWPWLLRVLFGWLLHALFPLRGRADKAAVLHDYVNARGVTENTAEQRRWSTGIFNRALKAGGVPTWQRFAMVVFVAVALFPEHYLLKSSD